MIEEEWRPIRGYFGKYEVSSLGRIKSLERIVDTKYRDGRPMKSLRKGRILKGSLSPNGYVIYALCKNGKQKYYTCHRIVMKTFTKNINKLPCINHINGDKTDNRVQNLEWCSASHNAKHSRHVLRRGNIRLTKDVVKDIRKDHSDGMSISDICQKYSISKSTVVQIKNRKSWV